MMAACRKDYIIKCPSLSHKADRVAIVEIVGV